MKLRKNKIKTFAKSVIALALAATMVLPSTVQTQAYTRTKSPYTGLTYTHKTAFDNRTVVNGIDVSAWNDEIDWKKVKASGVKYVFIRACYRSSFSGILTADVSYEDNIKGALDAGLKVGLYMFSQATTKAEAEAEAKLLISKAKGYNVTMPLIMDFEYNGTECKLYKANLTNKQKTTVCDTFLSTVESAGYTPMLYANYSMLSDELDSSYLSNKYKIWIARYNTSTGYSGDYDFWQYSSTGKVDGIKGNCDMNFWYDNGSIGNSVVKATGVEIEGDDITLAAGESKYLKANLYPEDSTETFRWTSTYPNVAYVTASGKVCAVAPGTTKIKVTTSKNHTDYCNVTVLKNIKDYKVEYKNGTGKYNYSGNEINPSFTVKSKKKLVTKAKVKEPVYVRTGPSVQFTSLELLKKGTKANVYGKIKKGGEYWYAIKCRQNKHTYRGYASASYFKVLKKGYDRLSITKDYTKEITNNVEYGKGIITLTGAGKVAGSKNYTFDIAPERVNDLKVVKKTKKSVTLSFAKNENVDGYIIYRASSKDGKFKQKKVYDFYNKSGDETEEPAEGSVEEAEATEGIVPEEFEAANEAEKTEEIIEFKDTKLKPGNEYYYKICAFKYVDDEKILSKESKVVSAACKLNKPCKAIIKMNCNIRKGAGAKYKILGYGAAGEKYKVISYTHDEKGKAWIKIKYKKGTNKTGYVLKSLAKIK